MLPLLEPLFQGPLRPYGQGLCLATEPPPGSVLVGDLLARPADLECLLLRHAAQLGHARAPGDLRPVASSWSLAYCARLLAPVCAAASLMRQALPIAASQVWLLAGEDGLPRSFHILGEGRPAPDEDTWQRYAPLVWTHLMPLFAALHAVSRVPPKLLWGNLGRRLRDLAQAAAAVPQAGARLDAEVETLLQHPWWGGAQPACTALAERPNPLHGRDRSASLAGNGHGAVVRLHRQCCLYYRLPGSGYCAACPLAPGLRPRD